MLSEKFMKLYDFLKETEARPLPFESFHLTWIAIVAAVTFILILLLRNAGDRTIRALTFVLWAVMALLELGKQLSGALHIQGGELVWSYAWHYFPFQFCSTPLYIMPLFVFLKEGKLRDAVIVFLTSYAFIGGLMVYLSPDTVFTTLAYTNMQTMVHHGIQLITGMLIAFKYSERLRLGNFLRSSCLFFALATVAFFLDVTLAEVFGKRINLFFISPYHRFIPNILKGYGLEELPYAEFVGLFLLVFISLSLFITLIQKILVKLTRYE